MAIGRHKGIPIGPWRTDIKTRHWLVYKTFVSYDDDSGNDYIQLQQLIRVTFQQAAAELQEHKIEVVNAQCEEMFDALNFGKVHKLAIGFSCREDLVMAKLVLKCEE
jgi:hypothetical protein